MLNFRYPYKVAAFQAQLSGGQFVRILPLIKRTMLDGKMRSIVSGRAGAYCSSCNQTAGSYYGKTSKHTADNLVCHLCFRLPIYVVRFNARYLGQVRPVFYWKMLNSVQDKSISNWLYFKRMLIIRSFKLKNLDRFTREWNKLKQ